MKLAFMTHGGIGNGIQIRHMGQTDGTANQFGTAITQGIGPDLPEKMPGIFRLGKGNLTGIFRRQRLEALEAENAALRARLSSQGDPTQ